MKDTFFFYHDYNARGDEKIINLFRAHGLQGYGLYWVLIEKLYESGGRIAADFDAIAYDIRTDADLVKSVATKFGLFYLTGSSRLIASKSVDRRLQERRERSEKARESAHALHRKRGIERPHSERSATAERPHSERMLERKKERKKEITAADGAPSAADLSRAVEGVVAKRTVTRALSKSDAELLDSQLPFSFGDIPRGRRIIDVDPASAQAILEKVPRLGLDVRRALLLRIEIKAQEGIVPDSRREIV